MNKTEAIRLVIDGTDTEPVVFTTGYACRIARHHRDRESHFYMTGSMGLAGPIGAGIAHSTGRPTVVVDGDGSLLMNPAGLATAAVTPGLPLLHIVLDDAAYASTGGQPTQAPTADFCGLARSFGYRSVTRVEEPGDLSAVLGALLSDLRGPSLVHCVLGEADLPVPPRVEGDLAAHTRRFSRSVRFPAGRAGAA
ncbi:thiamine pyrophosphate-dependent enzyme [Streptomyces sp. NPDC001852]|uniref:thiamine pyrophosphate-dependent enzyme n=1 Tax=Streptomyces sp. NPDC001852 TaxID=3364619 RepID=UPI0036BA5A94